MKVYSNMGITSLFILIFLFMRIFAQDNENYASRIITGILNFVQDIRNTFPQYPDQPDSEEAAIYDFIVVGAGPTGSVIANRLSEISEWKVLLLEAGGEATFFNDIPAACLVHQFTSQDWGYRTEKQKGFCRGCIDKRMNYPRGKCLGGSTNINFMIMVRGNKADYDKMARLGNPGWSYQEVLPYFKKLENAHIEINDKGYHGHKGPLTVTDIPFRTEAAGVFLEAVREAGHPYVDYNGKGQLGVSYVQGTIRDGRRCSSEKAYLRPVRTRENLDIFTRARVTKILINPKTLKAFGVRFYKDGQYYDLRARKEVIISAGGLNSPQLLMLSGIGPKQHLRELGIPILKDLPVGKVMYDHATFPGLAIQVNKPINLVITQIANISAIIDYNLNGKGPYTVIGAVEVLTYLKLKSSVDKVTTRPDVELIMAGVNLGFDLGTFLRRMFNIPYETYQKVIKPMENMNAIQILPMLLHPQSKGYMRLRSDNPFDPPAFYANFLSDPENLDVKIFIESIREVQRIIKQPSLQEYNAKLVDLTFPGCEHYRYDSDDYWECQLRTIIGSLYHQVSTCKMGPKNDPEAVVDAELKVHGINNLRVADVSVLPVTVSAHTMGPAYMIGEKASDMIKYRWGVK